MLYEIKIDFAIHYFLIRDGNEPIFSAQRGLSRSNHRPGQTDNIFKKENEYKHLYLALAGTFLSLRPYTFNTIV